jgi:hypothetical protein
VRSKATGKNARATYTVRLKKLPAGKRLFVLYRGAVHELTTEDTGSGHIKFTLNMGDPPIGVGP